MVKPVNVYRVEHDDGTFKDFTSLQEATRYELETRLAVALAGFVENVSPAIQAGIDAIVAGAPAIYQAIGAFLEAEGNLMTAVRHTTGGGPTSPAPQPEATGPAVVVTEKGERGVREGWKPAQVISRQPLPGQRPRAGSGEKRGPGYPVRTIEEPSPSSNSDQNGPDWGNGPEG